MRDNEFTSKLKPDELENWEAFVPVVKNSIGNQRAEKYMRACKENVDST